MTQQIDTQEMGDKTNRDKQEVCAQCESNARWNEAGGYHELAEKCREYCRRGHKEAQPTPHALDTVKQKEQ